MGFTSLHHRSFPHLLLSRLLSLSYILIITYFLLFVNTFFLFLGAIDLLLSLTLYNNYNKNFLFFQVVILHKDTWWFLVSLPIDMRRPLSVNKQNVQNGIIDFLKICTFLLLTSARWVWYNKTRAADGARAALIYCKN